jgi:hypothetical protein
MPRNSYDTRILHPSWYLHATESLTSSSPLPLAKPSSSILELHTSGGCSSTSGNIVHLTHPQALGLEIGPREAYRMLNFVHKDAWWEPGTHRERTCLTAVMMTITVAPASLSGSFCLQPHHMCSIDWVLLSPCGLDFPIKS